jgi:hypothetical protein
VRVSACIAVQILRIMHFEQDSSRTLSARLLCVFRVSAVKEAYRIWLRLRCSKPLRFLRPAASREPRRFRPRLIDSENLGEATLIAALFLGAEALRGPRTRFGEASIIAFVSGSARWSFVRRGAATRLLALRHDCRSG